MKTTHLVFIVLLILSRTMKGFGQDTLRLTLPDAEQRFLQKNFLLLAQKFNINLAEAAVTQSKLWDNPNFFMETNLYNPNTGVFFPFAKNADLNTPTGQAINLQFQQVLSLSKQRSKLIALAQTNVALQQAAFQDVMRSLRFQLAQTFGNLNAEQQQFKMLLLEKQQLERLLTAYQAQLKLGVVPEYEVTRLELEQKGLESNLANLAGQISQDQATLRVLLAENGSTYIISVTQLTQVRALPSLNTLVENAYTNRPDLQVAEKQILYNQQNLTYQQALATPRLTLGTIYSHVGNTYPNYFGLQAAIDLPFQNRNQGNIQAAKITIDQSNQGLNLSRLQVEQDVVQAYQQYNQALNLQAKISQDYLSKISEVSKNATEDYNKRIIDLVSFIDKIRAYKDAQSNLIDLQNNLFQAQQQLNFVTNSKTF